MNNAINSPGGTYEKKKHRQKPELDSFCNCVQSDHSDILEPPHTFLVRNYVNEGMWLYYESFELIVELQVCAWPQPQRPLRPGPRVGTGPWGQYKTPVMLGYHTN